MNDTVVVATADSDTVDLTALVLFHFIGVEAVLARDGLEAIELVRERKPRVLVLDLGVGKLSGRTVASLLKGDESTRQTAIIGLGDRDLGCPDYPPGNLDGFIATPIDVVELEAVVRSYLVPVN